MRLSRHFTLSNVKKRDVINQSLFVFLGQDGRAHKCKQTLSKKKKKKKNTQENHENIPPEDISTQDNDSTQKTKPGTCSDKSKKQNVSSVKTKPNSNSKSSSSVNVDKNQLLKGRRLIQNKSLRM